MKTQEKSIDNIHNQRWKDDWTNDFLWESESEHAEPVLSEYESTADESRDVEETEEDTDTEEYVTEEEETAEEEEDEEADKSGVVNGERQSGDGEEQPKLDIDEDRQNPAYIPKRGAFYEHDMRLDPDEEIKEGGDQQREDRGKGKLWKDDSKWVHDRFEQFDQAPKSRQELITMYGYDITQYDQPPDEPPKMSGRSRRGGRRDQKPQFQDFLPDNDKGGPNYRSNRYDDDSYDDRDPRQSKSETSNYRGGRGRRGQRRSEGGTPRRGYSDLKEDRAPRNRGFSDRGRDSRDGDFRNRDNYGNRDRDNYGNRDRDDNRNKDNYGNRDRDNYGNRDRDNFANRDRDNYANRDRDNFGNRDRDTYGNRDRENFGNRDRDNYGNRDRDNYGNKGQYDDSSRGRGNRDFQDRSEGRGGFRGRGRGGFKDNRRENRRDFGNRDNVDQQSGGRSNRENVNYERQYSGGRDGQNYERQNSGGRDADNQFRRPGSNRTPRNEPESPQQENTRYRGGELSERPPARSFDKPTPKSYYTLSVTDDEKLGEMEDIEYSPPAKGGVQDLNVTVTGERRSFNKDRPRLPRSQDYVQQSSVEERRDAGPSHGPNKHQPTLPPRLQQQQQQQERKKQKQQQQVMADKQDTAQSRSNKRYSSQRQRAVPEGPGYSEPQISQPPQQIVSSPLQQQFQPNFSPPKPAGTIQQSVIVRPAIATQMTAPPQQQTVGSPTLVIPRVPPPQSMIPVSNQVPPLQVRLQRPPPPAGPSPQGLGAPPPVFPSGSLPTSAMPAVSVIPAPLINPTRIVYAAPPPAYQVPVPQFSATPESHNPGETVRGGTTYYPQATPGSTTSPGTTYYSPEMQVAKQNRVQVRRPKIPLPIINPEEIKKESDSSSKEMEDDNLETYEEVSESFEAGEFKQELDDFDESLDSAEADGQESRLEADLEQMEEDKQAVTEEINTTQESESLDSRANLSDNISEEINESKSLESELNDAEQYSFESNEPGFNETDVNAEEITSGVDLESVVETSYGSAKDNEDVANNEELVSAEERLAESEEQSTEQSENLNEASKQSNVEDNIRSSTFVVKTDVLSPTLSVSTVIPEILSKEQTETNELDIKTEMEQVTSSVSEMNVSDNNVEDSTETEGNVEVDVATEKETKEPEESPESFEDAVEEVN